MGGTTDDGCVVVLEGLVSRGDNLLLLVLGHGSRQDWAGHMKPLWDFGRTCLPADWEDVPAPPAKDGYGPPGCWGKAWALGEQWLREDGGPAMNADLLHWVGQLSGGWDGGGLAVYTLELQDLMGVAGTD